MKHKLMIKTQCSKIAKKCNFKCTKTHFLHFQKWQKINFCTRKKIKTTKNPVFFSPKIVILVVLNFFSGAKLDFLSFLKWQKMWVFLLMKMSKMCVWVIARLPQRLKSMFFEKIFFTKDCSL